MELTENQWEHIWFTCDRPDIMVALLDERDGWGDELRREFCCSCARRALERNNCPLDSWEVAYNYSWREDITDEHLAEAREKALNLRCPNKADVIYSVWACNKNIKAAAQHCANQSSVDTEMRQIAETATLKRAMKLPPRPTHYDPNDKSFLRDDYAEDALEWVDAHSSQASEAQLQARWLVDHVKFPKAPNDRPNPPR